GVRSCRLVNRVCDVVVTDHTFHHRHRGSFRLAKRQRARTHVAVRASDLSGTTQITHASVSGRLQNHESAPQRTAEADQLTVHVIGIRVKGYTWMGEQSLLDTECLAEQNGGLYIGVESEDDLAKALKKTLGCPLLSQRALP